MPVSAKSLVSVSGLSLGRTLKPGTAISGSGSASAAAAASCAAMIALALSLFTSPRTSVLSLKGCGSVSCSTDVLLLAALWWYTPAAARRE
eukprot:16441-Heterococcus_DN1.PRE.2